MPTVGLTANVVIFGKMKKELVARIDTGATKSSMDTKLAKELGLETLREANVRSANSTNKRAIVVARVAIAGQQYDAEFTLADRKHMKYQVLIGQNILKKGFMIDATKP